MKRAAVYSTSRARGAAPAAAPQAERASPASVDSPKKSRLRLERRPVLASLAALALALLLGAGWLAPRGMNAAQVDEAIQRALEAQGPARPLAADAYEKILPAVVHVRGLATEEGEAPAEEDKEATPVAEGNVGTGVVIVDNGTI
ncbi:MAG TPA: hypothetical protein VEB41_08635, partial [Burkholderiales bacterium]|nr:hypothetical protein [Burkholderiales bacterium]